MATAVAGNIRRKQDVAYAEKERVRAAKRSRRAYEAAAEIGELPACQDPNRRIACGRSLLEFLTTYFPRTTGLSPLGQDQRNAVARIEVALREEGWIANIMPRGFIKSTLSENSVLWALLYGYRKYALFFAGTAQLATKGLSSIAMELTTNDLLLEDFPEACIPFRALEGKAARGPHQTYKGVHTGIVHKSEVIRLPMIPGFEGAGGIVEGYGLLAPPRGARFKNELGENVRPDVAVIDDPSTDESAKSDLQNESRLGYIRNSISMMGGHGNEMSLIVNATIIADNDLADRISDPDRSPEVQAVRIPMVKAMPESLETFWLKDYASLRRRYDRSDPRGRIKAKEASTALLKERYEEAHRGAIVSWENIGLEMTEISALQHAMNILIDKGPSTFFAECQNAPLRPTGIAALEITKDLASRVSGFEESVVPLEASFLVFGVDVHNELLYYTVAAVNEDFTGRIIQYGTFPEQPTPYFTLRSAKNTLSAHYKLTKSEDTERAIELGVEDLVDTLLRTDWRNVNGQKVAISGGAVDVGYKQKEVLNALRRLLPRTNIVMRSRGIGIGPTKKPMCEYDLSPKRIARVGPDPNDPRWLIPHSMREGELWGIQFDTNYWKSTLATRLTQSASAARWELYGSETRTDHGFYVSHFLAERPDQVSANGRTVDVWENAGNADNHYFDSAVLCAVVASACGARLPVASEYAPIRQLQINAPLKSGSPLLRDDDREFLVGGREY